MRLGGRLEAVAELIPPGSRVLDVGSDHGYLPAHLAERGLMREIHASDVAPGPLDSARRTAEARGVTDKITFWLADGVPGDLAGRVDAVVAAGMGGETIAGIVSRAPRLHGSDALLVLQTQSKLELLRASLRRGGYAVFDARLAEEAGRLYVILQARASGRDGGDIADMLFARGGALLPRYLAGLIARLERERGGLERSGGERARIRLCADRIEYYSSLLRRLGE